MCIEKEREYKNVKRHMKYVLRWLRSKKHLVTAALDLARPGVTPHAASLVQRDETCKRHIQARGARKQAASAWLHGRSYLVSLPYTPPEIRFEATPSSHAVGRGPRRQALKYI